MIHSMPDWSALTHAYGPATDVPDLLAGLRSADPSAAVERFHSALLHQGSVYDATVAVLPYLFELTTGSESARAAATGLLVSVAREIAVEGEYDSPNRIAAFAELRRRAAVFVALAADPAPAVRREAIPGLGVLLTDPAPIQALFPACPTLLDQLIVIRAAARLASLVPTRRREVLDWLDQLPDDPTIRLAVVVHRACLGAADADADLVPSVVALLGRMTEFGDGGEINRLLLDLHTWLDRPEDHVTLLTAQLRTPSSPAFHVAAIRTAQHLMSRKPPGLLELLTGQLAAAHPAVAAHAALAIEAEFRIPEPAREPLAALIARQGPDAWAAGDRWIRSAHQAAVRALLRLGDDRARPGVAAAFTTGVDTERAVTFLNRLPSAAEFVPDLRAHVLRYGASETSVRRLAELGGPAEIPALTAALAAAIDPKTVRVALRALAGFGPASRPALDTIRARASAAGHQATVAETLWAVTGDLDEVMPLLLDLLDSGIKRHIEDAAGLLRTIGPSASAAVPHLRTLLADDDEWTRVAAATTLWHIGGEPEAPAVINTLVRAAATNDATTRIAVPCLTDMHAAASPAFADFSAGRFDADAALHRTARTLLDRLP